MNVVLTVLVYLEVVRIITPTPKMLFYQCPLRGRVESFEYEAVWSPDHNTRLDDKIKYSVTFKCKHKTFSEFFYPDNLGF